MHITLRKRSIKLSNYGSAMTPYTESDFEMAYRIMTIACIVFGAISVVIAVLVTGLGQGFADLIFSLLRSL